MRIRGNLMEKYNGLLSKIASQYHIPRGDHESENAWRARIIYSICGMMAYASLWDDESEVLISQQHLKSRIHEIFSSYLFLYPELSNAVQYTSKELEDEITEQFINGGIVYQRPYDLIPSIRHEALFDDALFQRGISIDEISCVSGIGFYSLVEEKSTPWNLETMFGLEQKNLHQVWQTILSSASWQQSNSFAAFTEYLRLRPPFTEGYWKSNPEQTGNISILRTGMKGSWLYYLYRCDDGKFQISPLPEWQTESQNYLLPACACLSAQGTLPSIEYAEDGALVHVHLNYLLPPSELNFLKMYSWPENGSALPCSFHREISVEVFTAIKGVLSAEGYQFKERGII